MRHVDRQDRSRLARRLTAALLTSATMAAHAAPPPPELVPRDAARDRAFAAAGIQVYSCEYDGNHRLAWTFQHPEATLYDAAGVAVIKHGAGPAWEAQDGSRIVGEKLAEREAGATEQVVGVQLAAVLAVLSQDEAARIVVAYEPVWAIGTGRSATAEQAQQVHAFLRGRLAAKGAERVSLLYGGSVKADNAAELFSQPDIDGGLIGGASLKSGDFLAICRAAQ